MTDDSILLHLLRQRKRWLLLSGIATACFGFAISQAIPPSYMGEGVLIVESHTSPGETPTTASPTLLNDIATQIDVLQSSGLIRNVVKDLNLIDAPGLIPRLRLPQVVLTAGGEVQDWLSRLRHYLDSTPPVERLDTSDDTVTFIRKHLLAEAKENSSTIVVKFTGATPVMAATVTNAIMADYLRTLERMRNAQVEKTTQWVTEQGAIYKKNLGTLESKVADFIQSHDLSEVQGSSTRTIQLSKDLELLTAARLDVSQKEAALRTIQAGGTIRGAQETLESKTIQLLKEISGKIAAQIAILPANDPRRGPLQAELIGVKNQMDDENKLIVIALTRTVDIAKAHLRDVEQTVRQETAAVQDTTVAGATLKQLVSDLDASRTLYVNLLSQASQARFSAERARTAHILFQAVPPQRPAHAYGALSLVLGFVAGIVGAAALIVLRNAISKKINSADEMLSLPVFGSLPTTRNMRIPIVTETFRAVWVAVRGEHDDGMSILVTSSEVHEGKTTVAMALATLFADDGFHVLLVDADLRRPSIAKKLKIIPELALEDALGRPIEEIVEHVAPRLDCALSNGRSRNPVRTLSSPEFAQFLTDARARYDFVIIDSPPVLHVADPVLIGKLSQHILFVVQAGRMSNPRVNEAVHRFEDDEQAKMLFLMTCVPQNRLQSHFYSGYSAMSD